MRSDELPEPSLVLREGVPIAVNFDDVYFSREGGIAETIHVFLRSNRLPERWQNGARFTIAELGFGTGLNFRVTLQQWEAHAPTHAQLEYHAVEKYPLSRATLAALFAHQPELAEQNEALLDAYPARIAGPHRLVFGRVTLTLWFGDVAEWLPHLHQIDAWYLDGFSPAKNPDMWCASLWAPLAAASARGATFATFTAASAVRRGLQDAGFTVEKVSGFGRKRDMLRGQLPTSAVMAVRSPLSAPITVLGGGIAGVSVARALAERQYSVTLIERTTLASGASGNPAGVLFPPLAKRWRLAQEFYFAAYVHALRLLAQTPDVPHASPGMLRLPRHAQDEDMLRALPQHCPLDASVVHWLDRQAASDQAGLELPSGAAFFPQGSWVSPVAWCQSLVQHPNILLRENTTATALEKYPSGWRITLATGEQIEAPQVVVAGAMESATLLTTYGLTLHPVGGQITEIAADDVAAPLRSILCRKGYVIAHSDRYLIGATYHREGWEEVTAARHAENLDELQSLLPGWYQGRIVLGGRSSIRATTPDRLPYIGALDTGLYVSTGHGSRGLLSAPLAAEIIACQMAQQPLPITDALATGLSPQRRSQR